MSFLSLTTTLGIETGEEWCQKTIYSLNKVHSFIVLDSILFGKAKVACGTKSKAWDTLLHGHTHVTVVVRKKDDLLPFINKIICFSRVKLAWSSFLLSYVVVVSFTRMPCQKSRKNENHFDWTVARRALNEQPCNNVN